MPTRFSTVEGGQSASLRAGFQKIDSLHSICPFSRGHPSETGKVGGMKQLILVTVSFERFGKVTRRRRSAARKSSRSAATIQS
jgi:hypothetical protein